MMYCSFCKKQIEDDALFCPYCGKSAPQGDALAELAAAARTGDQDAIGALYEKTYSKVYYTVKSMIKDEDAVFDIVQDTYIKAFAHLDSFQGDTKFLPWVRQIAANTARDWLKKKRPMLFTELSSGDGQDTPVEEQFPDERSDNLPDQIIDQKETKRLIREIIEELPEDQRAVIGMFYYEEMSVKEIAAVLGVSESAVKSRLMYGRNKIEKKVRELEKKGTKLYSLSPLLFLLLLFRSQKAYACEAPDGRILDAVLASRPTGSAAASGAAQGADTTGAVAGAAQSADATKAAAGAAQGADTTGAASGAAQGADATKAAAGATQGADTTGAVAGAAQGADTAGAVAGAGTAGTGGAGTAAAAGGLGALKIGLIALAAVAVVGLGAFGAIQIASHSSEPQKSPAGNLVGQKEPGVQKEPEASAEPGVQKEPEASAEPGGRNESEASAESGGQNESEAQKGPEATKEPEAPKETESPKESSAPVETETPSAPKESEEPSFPVSYIFSDMPIAAYEVTGLGVGLNEEVYAELVIDPEGMYDYGAVPFVKLESSNTFVLFCMRSGIIRSSSGSSRWEANEYGQMKDYYPEIEGYASGAHSLLKPSVLRYSEAADDGGIYETFDQDFFRFFEIYHPDAPQEEPIYVTSSDSFYGDVEFREETVDTLKLIGASNVQEISVEEALKKFHITVSEEEMEKAVFPGSENKYCTSYVIPDGVKTIGEYAFMECYILKSVEIPNSVTGIGDYAFDRCSRLTSIEIPDSVTWIGDHAFCLCTSLTSIEIPNSVTWIGNYAFSVCESLTSIEIPNSVTVIGDLAFSDCESLTGIEIPNSVTVIGDGAFCNCRGLTSIEIPNSVTVIGSGAFDGCRALTSIEIPNSVTVIAKEAFRNCESLTSIEIPNSVTGIGNDAFTRCSALTDIEIPKSVTKVGRHVFSGCRALKTIKVPEGLDVSNWGLGKDVQVIYY